MDLIPHDELKPVQGINYAPMIDFLFLMLSLFATLALSRAALYDTDITLAELKPEKGAVGIQSKNKVEQINLSIGADGGYKWLTEFQEYPMKTVTEIQEELSRQYQMGVISSDKLQTEVLLHIDKRAPWESVASAIFAVRELGFSAHPVFEGAEGNTYGNVSH